MSIARQRITLLREVERDFGELLTRLRHRIEVPGEVDEVFHRQLRYAFDDYLDDYHEQMHRSIRDSAGIVTDASIAGGLAYVAASNVTDAQFTFWLNSIPDQVANGAMDRVLPSGLNLSERIWDLRYLKDIEAIVRNGVANNLSPELIAKQLDGFVLPGRHVTTLTPYGRSLNFDSMRLARTEVLRSYRATSVEVAKKTPWITGETWHLSIEHPDLGCECEDYDGQTFDPADVPMDPHPLCGCYLTHEMLTDQQWDNALSEFYATGKDELGIGEWLGEM